MAWPVLGAKRAAADAAKRAAIVAEPEPPQKRPKIPTRQRPDNLKLDTLFRGKALPIEIEAVITEFALPLKYQLFKEKYGKPLAVHTGEMFVNGWHPRIASTTRERYGWAVFEQPGITLYPVHKAPPITQCTQAAMKPLIGKEVLVRYQKKTGAVTLMAPKRVIDAFCGYMTLGHTMDDPDDRRSHFDVCYSGVLAVDLFVDIPLHETIHGIYSKSKGRYVR